MSSPIKLHVPEPLEGVALAQPLWFKFPQKSGSILFNKHLPPSFFEQWVEFASVEEAVAIVLPNNFNQYTEAERAYVERYADSAEANNIPIFVFCGGDFTDAVRFDPRAYVFRQSIYRSTMQPQDISTPTITEDNAKDGFALREKQQVPVVSFCGQGDYQTFLQQVKYHIKVWRWKLAGFVAPHLRARIIGVYWRKKMMSACEASKKVATHFIVRKSFSGAHRTIELDPAQARREYLESIVNSDFVLAPKGDGNYSNRFLKTLCMGRIPVLPDTDAVLPLEQYIDYKKVCVYVPMSSVQHTPEIIAEWYNSLTKEEWEAAQYAAREVFATKLRFDSFFKFFFSEVLPTLPVQPE